MQHNEGQEQAASAAAQTAEQKLKQHGQAASGPKESSSRAEQAPGESRADEHGGQMGSQLRAQRSTVPAAKGADSSAGQLQAQQKPQESSVSKGVPRLRIPPLSPRPASGLELPGSRAAQPDSSAKSRGNAPEQLPDEGWSPRQVSMFSDKSQLQHTRRSWAVLTL